MPRVSPKQVARALDELAHPRKDWTRTWKKKSDADSGWVSQTPGLETYYRRAAGYTLPRQLYGQGMYTGRGGYLSSAWGATAGLRKMAGKYARRHTNPIVRGMGRVSKALGIGAYTTNSLVNGGQGAADGVPTFGGDGVSTVTISHREYISDVYGTPGGQSFQNTAYSLNPGLENTFPWLAQIAQNYDEYTIKQLMFTFRSSIAPIGASSSGQVGTVIMATQYNAGEEPFTDKESMMQYDGSMSAKVIDGLISGVECDPAQMSGSTGKFTRAGPPPVGQDIKTYDLGTFNVAITNIPSSYENQSLGELWVSYTVELRKPKFFAAQGFGIIRDTFLSNQQVPFRGPFTASVFTQESGTPPNLVPASIVVGQTPALFLTGQQNSIGALLFSKDGAGTAEICQFGVLFPAQFAGAVSVTFRLWSTITTETTAAQLTINPFASAYGNTRLIEDIPANVGSPATTVFVPQTTSWSYDPGTGSWVLTLVCHVHLSIASGGADNFVTWPVHFVNGSEALIGPWANASCDITEYNTMFNYKQNGVNDDIVYVNPGGSVVLPTP